jgi:hypothetical protein
MSFCVTTRTGAGEGDDGQRYGQILEHSIRL